jgi:hypothetical protein
MMTVSTQKALDVKGAETTDLDGKGEGGSGNLPKMVAD